MWIPMLALRFDLETCARGWWSPTLALTVEPDAGANCGARRWCWRLVLHLEPDASANCGARHWR